MNPIPNPYLFHILSIFFCRIHLCLTFTLFKLNYVVQAFPILLVNCFLIDLFSLNYFLFNFVCFVVVIACFSNFCVL